MRDPLVSVVLIFLNEERFIREAIESVLAQTYGNWELLLADDGSTDASTEIARRYAGKCPRKIRYLDHAGHENRGMSASRNLGIRNARGEYIAFVDADDVWLPNKLDRQVSILESEPAAGMVYGPTKYWFSWSGSVEDRNRDLISELPLPADRLVAPPALLVNCSPLGKIPAATTCSLLIRRELVEEVGGFEESFRGWGEDQAFLAKVHLKAKVYLSGECLAQYRFHGESCVSRTVSSGDERSANSALLSWIEEYLDREGVQDTAVCRALRKALWPYRHPVRHWVSERLLRRGKSAWSDLRTAAANRRRRHGASSGGSIQADPNPTVVSQRRFNRGATTLSWTSWGVESVEVRIDRPDGPLFSRTGSSGKKSTGDWVHDDMVFFLQDVFDGKPLTRANTLDAVRVKVREPVTRRIFLIVKKLRERLTHRGLILLYHRVAEIESDPWSLSVTPQHFAEQLDALKSLATPIGLPALVDAVHKRKLPRSFVALTFDDGYADNLYNAKPLLERHGVPATFFIVSGYVGQEREFWWDEMERFLLQPATLPGELHLTVNGTAHQWDLGDAADYDQETFRYHQGWRPLNGKDPTRRYSVHRSLYDLLQPLPEEERLRVIESLRVWSGAGKTARPENRPLTEQGLVELATSRLVSIGAHTVTHPLLPQLSTSLQEVEIKRSKAELEELTGAAVKHFTYPYGRFSDETVELVRNAEFAGACTDSEGVVHRRSDPFCLPRFRVEDWDGEEFARRLSRWIKEFGTGMYE